MARCPTLDALLWPSDEAAQAMASEWVSSMTMRALDYTWRGYDSLCKKLHQIDFSQKIEQLERSLTGNHFAEIQRIWARETGGEATFFPHHENPEMETRSSASAKPPAYDLAFVCDANRRYIWPIEAKVIITPGALAPYLGDVVKFTKGTAAPLVGSGGLIAYLRSGTTEDFFSQLQTALHQTLSEYSSLSHRSHKTSVHERTIAPRIVLHHMAMLLQ
jgi:hypothetical protein